MFDGHDRRAPQAGKYTLIFPGNPASADLPGGDSYATFTVSTAGTIRLAGSLADGTKISQSVPVALDGEWPLYASLYGGHGLLAGRMQFTLGAERDLGGTATWIKPAIEKDKFYPVGFTNEVMASGAGYVQPGSGSNVLSYANGKVSLSGGGLPEPIVNLISIGAGNRVTNLSSNALRLSFMISNGRFNGSVTGPASSKPVSFGGVVLQREGIARGYFVGTNQSGRVLVEP